MEEKRGREVFPNYVKFGSHILRLSICHLPHLCAAWGQMSHWDSRGKWDRFAEEGNAWVSGLSVVGAPRTLFLLALCDSRVSAAWTHLPQDICCPSTDLGTMLMQHEMDTWPGGQKESGPLQRALWLSWDLLPACVTLGTQLPVCVWGGEHTCACTHANDISHICGLGASVGTRKMAKVMKGAPFGPSLAEP